LKDKSFQRFITKSCGLLFGIQYSKGTVSLYLTASYRSLTAPIYLPTKS